MYTENSNQTAALPARIGGMPPGATRDLMTGRWRADDGLEGALALVGDGSSPGALPVPETTPALLFIEAAQRELVHLMRLIAEGDSAAATRVAWCMVERGRTVLGPEARSSGSVAPQVGAGAGASAGTHALSRRELDVLRMISQGLSNRQIAEASHRSLHTVDAHVKNIYRKLAVKSRARAVREAMQKGLIDLEACE
jgi:DNA-binding CsgD family transcriptional regulator